MKDERRWIALVAWTVVLFIASSAAGAAENTSGPIAWLVHAIAGPVSDETLRTIHFVVRKLAHLVGYAIEGLLALRAFRGRVVPALAVTLVVAALDELNQSRLPSRTGSAADVALDMAGATIAVTRRGRAGRPPS